ncbi:response regulator [Polynucleobacter kasalickyi]|uniref:Regulatory protein, Fis family n=1 Tax=Polynucleobacter kasalickyi TaxID=1938817 RepID=A0A1W2BRI1_9BURK|nr:response regulator [Polynucleobacter kasalickyi]SMC75334.1 regulatory protein, Fis family [Polynucleobacter kasalickyi]
MANILVVDDEMGIRELLNEILSDEGHVVYSAENAQQARTVRDQLQPDLVLLDIWMPDTDGVTLLKEWSKDNKLTMPVVMMSGHATIDTAVEATRIGACNFLEKPIALQKLLKTVNQALERVLPKEDVFKSTSNVIKEYSTTMLVNAAEKTGIFDASRQVIDGESVLPGSADAELNPGHFDLPLREARDIFEKAYFEYHLKKTGGSMTKVSEYTGLERTHLYRKLKALGIDVRKAGSNGN